MSIGECVFLIGPGDFLQVRLSADGCGYTSVYTNVPDSSPQHITFRANLTK